ncbi:MAG: polyribonucleotide nucleotidyltransferase [Candidatus Sumerlaeia bacterium]|nr:polyribonucleotide nucleotidyltransferase [Candidatus Sumerlaeia bacterium]
MERLQVAFGRKELFFEFGRLAKQANAAVLGQTGGTVALAAVVAGPSREGVDFFPLTVDYRDKFYASGRIPGSFFRREGRPSDAESLRARLIDRPLRPLFPEGYNDDTQVYVTVLSSDNENPPELVGFNATAMALLLSDIPFTTPVAAVRVGRMNGAFILNPTYAEIDAGDLDLVVAGTEHAVNMVEAGAREVSESDIVEAMRLAHEEIQRLCREMAAIAAKYALPKRPVAAPQMDPVLREAVEAFSKPLIADIQTLTEKQEREERLNQSRLQVQQRFAEEFPEQEKTIGELFDSLYQREVRRKILDEGVRADGRGPTDIRPITVEVGVLPRTHGSALFTRGQTQALGVCTLGTAEDMLLIDDLLGVRDKAFYLHYNFPAYSVGEVRPIRGPGRREIGHGALAERALLPTIPKQDDFPYTIRVVSEILESNGSSSMASVCAGSLSLMDCGVPVSAPVSGIAMGLVKEGDRTAILSDILGLEDHLGDMDFKVAGTRKGITALQMDIKIEGVTFEIIKRALEQAREGRLFILDKMCEVLPRPRPELSPYAPRITMIQIPVDRIRDVIGPGGKTIREITAKTNTKIDIEDDGRVFIAATKAEDSQAAIDIIKGLTAVPEIGKIYSGKVVRIADFGCFVEFLPGQDGLVHISELENHRVGRVEDVCREGDTLLVKVIGIDPQSGKIRLSRRQALEAGQTDGASGTGPRSGAPSESHRPAGHPHSRPGGHSDRDRGRDRGGRGRRY